MLETIGGFPFWILEFDKRGHPVDPALIDKFMSDAQTRQISDLFVFSHGWNNDHAAALSLYKGFFEAIAAIHRDATLPKKRPNARIGLAGIFWPSILWPDDAASAGPAEATAPAGEGAAAVGSSPPPVGRPEASPGEINQELKKAYGEDRQQTLVDELTAMLEERQRSNATLNDFRDKLAELLASEPADAASDRKQPDYAEVAIGQLDDDRWRDLLDLLASQSVHGSSGGAAGFGDLFDKLWAGAKDALRIATYWQMKQRAGIVGRDGLGAGVLAKLAQSGSKTRVHLIGHSFGARLVSFSLAGLPRTLTGSSSPVKSLFLLQGAFSHYAFADRLPHDASRSGALKGMASRVDGPLLTTHSRKDLAVGLSYPAASFVNQDDAAAAVDQSTRWGAMGHDGAQAVGAADVPLAAPGKVYRFETGKWLNLDGNKIIVHGGLPAGAHSDIVHPHTAWAALAAAGVV